MVPAPDADAVRARILIVDDEPLIRATVAESLRDAGFSVVEAADADEALAYVEAGGPVDLVISDIRMPGSMDGIELARKLKTAHPSLPVILTSANFAAGNVGDLAPFIRKPYRLVQMIALVIQTLGLRQSNESDE